MEKVKVVIRYLFLCLLFASCSNALVDDIKRGADYNYQPGFPELRLEVSEHISEADKTYLKIVGNVVENSLVFKRNGDSLSARINIDINIINHDTGKNYQLDFSPVINKTTDNEAGERIFSFVRDVNVPAGNYEIRVSVTDLASQKVILRSAEAYLPNPLADENNITNISILTKDKGEEFKYVSTYDISIMSDSVKFTFQVTNNKVDDPISIESRLIRFRSDSTVAAPMSFSNPSASNIIYKGIDYGEYDVIQSSQREFRQPGNVIIEYIFTNLERGNYRFEVAENLNNKERLYKARDFGVKSDNYPALKTARELARPLIYLMSERDHKRLMSISNDDSLKQALDRFWLENIQNSALARSVISLYYQRVEEANKMFSNYKEGWKTDRGRVFILFGPPLDVYRRLREVRWSYNFNQEDPDYTYYFRNLKTKTKSYPFENYMLRRDNRYHNIEYRQRQLWLSGDIMTDKL